MRDKKVMFSHNTDDWKTSTEIIQKFIEKGFKDTFKYKGIETYNEFECVYHNEKLYCNPPYSKLKNIVKWINTQIENNCVIVLNIPSRTDTKYFHQILELNPLIYFIKGRLKFGEHQKSSAPFPSLFVYISKGSKINTYDYGSVEKFMEKYL